MPMHTGSGAESAAVRAPGEKRKYRSTIHLGWVREGGAGARWPMKKVEIVGKGGASAKWPGAHPNPKSSTTKLSAH